MICFWRGIYQWLRVIGQRLGVSDSRLPCSGPCGVFGGHHKWEPMCDCDWYASFRKCGVCGSGVVAEALLVGVNSEGVVLCKSSVE